jgi:predicted thioesterase
VECPELPPGLKAEGEAVVSESMVTRHAGGHRGGVLTTPSMIAFMEEVAQAVIQPYLPPDHTTVGFEVSVRHLAPTLLGERFSVIAELLEANGRKLLFRVDAHNPRGKMAEGTLRRTVVSLGSLEERGA